MSVFVVAVLDFFTGWIVGFRFFVERRIKV
jgi:hypothetical protein